MFLNEPGAGKTMMMLSLLVFLLKLSMYRLKFKISVLLVTYTPSVFYKQVQEHPGSWFCPLNDFLKKDSKHSPVFTPPAPNITMDIVGYRKFATKVFNILDEKGLSKLIVSSFMVDPLELINIAIKNKILTINEPFVKTLDNSIICLDEAQKLQSDKEINNHGLALFYAKKMCKNVFIVYISATPMNQSAIEFAFIQCFLLEDSLSLPYNKCFTPTGELIPDWKIKISPLFKGRVFYSEQPKFENTPSLIYEGSNLITDIKGELFTIGNKMKMTFVESSDFVKKMTKTNPKPNLSVYLFYGEFSGFPVYDKESLNKVIQRPNILSKAGIYVAIDNSGTSKFRLYGPGLLFKNISKYAPKISYLKQWFWGEQRDGLLYLIQGNGIIHIDSIDFPGVEFIANVCVENGFIDGDRYGTELSICLRCLRLKKDHTLTKNSPHKTIQLNSGETCCETGSCFKRNGQVCGDFLEIRFRVLHAYIPGMEEEIIKFVNPKNKTGIFAKFLIVSRVLQEAVTINNTPMFISLSIPKAISGAKQMHFRTCRPGALEGIGMNVVRVKMLVTTNNDPKNPTREESTITRKYLKYLQILEIIESLIEISVDKYVHEPVKTKDLVGVKTSSYYALGFSDYIQTQLCCVIKQLFSYFRTLNRETIYLLIKMGKHFKSTINFAAIDREEVNAALHKVTTDASSVDSKYLSSNVGISVLYQMTAVNLVIYSGMESLSTSTGIICFVQHIGDGVYTVRPVDSLTAFNNSPFINIQQFAGGLTTQLIIKTTNILDHELINSKLSQYQHDDFLYHLGKFPKKQLIQFVKWCIESWEKNPNDPNVPNSGAKLFLWEFVKSREVLLPSDLRKPITAQLNTPIGYMQDEKIATYSHNTKKWTTESTTISNLVELENKYKYKMFINRNLEVKIYQVSFGVNHTDRRRNTNGKKCSTMAKSESRDIYIKLLDGESDTVPLNIKTSTICNNLKILLSSRQFADWNQPGDSFTPSSTLKYTRHMHFLTVKK
jgi:hypothetical protein